ncbi:hypothetical protein PSY31_23335, partial [Shigella flexneri]|nr:hypothetical protein [Shigella flexneri]
PLCGTVWRFHAPDCAAKRLSSYCSICFNDLSSSNCLTALRHSLEREISKLCRKAVKQLLLDKSLKHIAVNFDMF